ncbi:MAG: hypothetical protein ACKOPH_04435 [Methylocystis sp.]
MIDDSPSSLESSPRQLCRCALVVVAAAAFLVLDLQFFAGAFAQPAIALGSRIEAESGQERLIFDLTGPVKISARPLSPASSQDAREKNFIRQPHCWLSQTRL